MVEIAGQRGTVRSLDLFTTELSNPDNLRVVIPNSKAYGDVIINHSRSDRRRIELHFGVDYADNLDTALDTMKAFAAADPRVLDEPAPWAKVTALADSSVTVTIRAWVRNKDYWDTRYDLTKVLKEQLEAAGLSFPYPHQVSIEAPTTEPDPPAPREPRSFASEQARGSA